MGELAERTTSVVSGTAGNVVNSAVAALMGAAAVATGNPDLAMAAVPGGALAGALTEEGIDLLRQAWRDKSERVGRFADTAERAAGRPIEELIEQTAADHRLRELMARTVRASAQEFDFPKIDIFARAFVYGAQDGDAIDEMVQLVELLDGLDVPHIRVLSVLWRRSVEADHLGDPGSGLQLRDFRNYDPALGRVVIALQRRLEEHGMVEYESGSGLRLTETGAYAAEILQAIGTELMKAGGRTG